MLTLDGLRAFLRGETTAPGAGAPPASTRTSKVGPPRVGPPKVAPPAGGPPAATQGEFARRLMMVAGFGDPAPWSRDKVLLGLSPADISLLPYWVEVFPPTATRKFQLLVLEAERTTSGYLGGSLLRRLEGEKALEVRLERMCQAALDGFAHGAGTASLSTRPPGVPFGRHTETVVVAAMRDDRFDADEPNAPPVHLLMFATCVGSPDVISRGEGLETFLVRQECVRWEPQLFEEYTERIFKRHFERLAKEEWTSAFVVEEEREKAKALLKLAKAPPKGQAKLLGPASTYEQDLQTAAFQLLNSVAQGFGLRGRQALNPIPLPHNHDIAADATARDDDRANPLPGVLVRDQTNRLLGYIVYCLENRLEAEVLRERLERDNCFHNVLVIVPDAKDPTFELWQGTDRLEGKLRGDGAKYVPEARLISLIARFFVVGRNRLSNPTELAGQLARRAQYLRRVAERQLSDERREGGGQLTELYDDFRTGLIHGMTEKEFADAYAQTMTYGLLSARWVSKDELLEEVRKARKKTEPVPQFTRSYAQQHLGSTSPFLQSLFEKVLHDGFEPKLAWLLDDIAALLNRVEVDQVFRRVLQDDATYDPIYHFYEPFLDAYDRALKTQLGVFYTPLPVVRFMIRCVHEELVKEFGLADGLASEETWRDVHSRHPDVLCPSPELLDRPFVKILDPATGTGTFLVELAQFIHDHLTSKWKSEGVSTDEVPARWTRWVREHLLARLTGIEVMVAPYAIAHLKLGLKLKETGVPASVVNVGNIVLSNALESSGSTAVHLFPAAAHEARRAHDLKGGQGYTVVIGNPPYANYSANLSPECRAIVDGFRTFGGTPIRERNQLQFERNIQDDCVKFVALGHRLLVQQSTAGVLALITNASVLASPSLRGMRERLGADFVSSRTVHLHGASSEKRPSGVRDENVFPIDTPVAIHVHTRGRRGHRQTQAMELWGNQAYKFGVLGSQRALSYWPVTQDKSNVPFWSPKPELGEAVEHPGWPRLDSLSPVFGAGIKTGRDPVSIAMTRQELREQVRTFLGRPLGPTDEKKIYPILYRPFDVRFIYYDDQVVDSRSLPTMSHMIGGGNLALVSNRSWTSPELFSVFVSDTLVEMKAGTHDRGTTVFPALLLRTLVGSPPVVAPALRVPGLDPGVTSLHYAYAVYYSSLYRRTYRTFLTAGFPLTPSPAGDAFASAMVELGRRLVELHLLRPGALEAVQLPEATFSTLPTVESRRWLQGEVSVCKGGRFHPVPEEVWNFHIGGYQVCDKWLKDRKGRTLTAEDILHYRRIVAAIGETIHIMAEIDRVIDAHGGWPGAFASSPPAASDGSGEGD